MKKQNKKNNRAARNVFGQKCIAKEVTLNKENALEQYLEVLNDIEQQHLLCQRVKRCGDVKMQRNVVEILMVIADGHIRYPLCGFRGYKRGVNLFKCLPAVLIHRDLLSHKNGSIINVGVRR